MQEYIEFKKQNNNKQKPKIRRKTKKKKNEKKKTKNKQTKKTIKHVHKNPQKKQKKHSAFIDGNVLHSTDTSARVHITHNHIDYPAKTKR